MSLSNFFSIYDKKSQKFNKPFTAENDEDAKRSITLSLKHSQEILLRDYPLDFALYCLADYNIDTAEIIACKSFVVDIANLVGVVKEEKVEEK